MNYFIEENSDIRKVFDLDKILAFTAEHDVQIIRGEDWNYNAYIDRKVYGSALTPLGAMVYGIIQYENLLPAGRS